MVSLVGPRVPRQGGHRGINPPTALPPSLLSLQFLVNNHSLSISIRLNHQILLPTNDSLPRCLLVPASRSTVPNGTTSLDRRSNLPCRRTNNPTSQMGMAIPSRPHSAAMTTIAMALQN